MNPAVMSVQEEINYRRIAEAIRILVSNHREPPSLEQLAEQVNLSPFHFQRLFSEWAGTTPKKFLQYISITHAKQVLSNRQTTLADAAFETGLSGTGRLHDLFVTMEGMTPAEYRNGGKELQINYQVSDTRFGKVLVASTQKGICHLSFYEQQENALDELRSRFPNAAYANRSTQIQERALKIFEETGGSGKIRLHVKGTPFQLKVWEALLRIPSGRLLTYGDLASEINQPSASRAVGTAIGSNPVAYVIPCHRVIQSTGLFGGYMWGPDRKTAIIGWEMAQASRNGSATVLEGRETDESRTA